jgi:hypothetical protein
MSETVYAGPGSWIDTTDRWIDRDSDLADIERQVSDRCRAFRVRCGGCPAGTELLVPGALLEDQPMPALMAYYGWQVSPLRCPYCLGTKERPDDPSATPYPLAPETA